MNPAKDACRVLIWKNLEKFYDQESKMHDHHSHSHPDHGHHHHSHEENEGGQLDFAQKLTRRLENWRHHNEDHLDGYRQWAETTATKGYPEVSSCLGEILALSRQITERLDRALASLGGGAKGE